MSQLFLFPDLSQTAEDLSSCHHLEKVSTTRGDGFDLMACVDCGKQFFAVYKWDRTELGAYKPVVSIPLPPVDRVHAMHTCELLSQQGWKTAEDESGDYLQCPNGGAKVRDIVGIFGEWKKTGGTRVINCTDWKEYND